MKKKMNDEENKFLEIYFSIMEKKGIYIYIYIFFFCKFPTAEKKYIK